MHATWVEVFVTRRESTVPRDLRRIARSEIAHGSGTSLGPWDLRPGPCFAGIQGFFPFMTPETAVPSTCLPRPGSV
jgi:hypothetical protein